MTTGAEPNRPETTMSMNGEDHFPEVVPTSNFRAYDSSYEHFQPHRSPVPEYISPPQMSSSPAPAYVAYNPYRTTSPVSATSPRFSSASPPPPLAEGITRSATESDGGYPTRTPAGAYSQFYSPEPEKIVTSPVIYPDDEKEYDNRAETINSVAAPIAPSAPTRTQSIARKPIVSQAIVEQQPTPSPERRPTPQKRPFYKRPLCWVLVALLIIAIIVAAVCGAVLGKKSSKSTTTSPSPAPTPNNPTPNNTIQITGNPDYAVGGYLTPSYYSHTGAFNGSGIALASANPGIDYTTYIYYQDYTGSLFWTLRAEDGSYHPFGQINDQSSNPMNGTPISVVLISPNTSELAYHLFYIDQDYTIVHRVYTVGGGAVSGSQAPLWVDGPLTAENLKTLQNTTIGLQACYWNNYYGGYTSNYRDATDAIHLFFATSETSFAQWDYTNGTDTTWSFVQNWDGYDGHTGVGCQTWESWMFEYIFFVDLNQTMQFFWRDNNQSAESTPTHPTLQWNQVEGININNVQKASSLGYTTYMIYQDETSAICGANISWAAENNTMALTSSGQPDTFVIKDFGNKPVPAVRATHLTITALKTASGGAELQAFFQSNGSDVSIYTRDMFDVSGLWQESAPVVS